jgi:hypothetical protein
MAMNFCVLDKFQQLNQDR